MKEKKPPRLAGDVVVFNDDSDYPGHLGILHKCKDGGYWIIETDDLARECFHHSEFEVIDHIDFPLCACGCGKIVTEFYHEDCVPIPTQVYHYGGWEYRLEQVEENLVHLIRKCKACGEVQKGYPSSNSYFSQGN